MIKRTDNYHINLCMWARNKVGTSFRWGANDCITLLKDTLYIMYEYFLDIPQYSTSGEAMRVYRSLDRTPSELLQYLGFHTVSQMFSQNGDIVVVNTEHMQEIGIVVDGRILSASEQDGIGWITVEDILDPFTIYRA